MSLLRANPILANRKGIDASRSGEIRIMPFSITLAVALVLNDVIGLVKLPANHKVVDFFANVPDLDTGAPAIILDAGLWENDSETAPTVVAANCIVDGSTAGQAGGIMIPNVGTFLSVAKAGTDRIVGLLVQVGPATGVVGTIDGWVSYRPVNQDDA